MPMNDTSLNCIGHSTQTGKRLRLRTSYNPAFQGHSARRFDPPALRAIRTDGNVRTGRGQEDQRAADGLQAGKIIDLRSRAAEV